MRYRTLPPPPPRFPIQPGVTIQQDVDCASCAYNLRGLQRQGHCPECGAPIAPSLDLENRKQSLPITVVESEPRDIVGCLSIAVLVPLLSLGIAAAVALSNFALLGWGLALTMAALVAKPLVAWWTRSNQRRPPAVEAEDSAQSEVKAQEPGQR
jgi:hypothetical protein